MSNQAQLKEETVPETCHPEKTPLVGSGSVPVIQLVCQVHRNNQLYKGHSGFCWRGTHNELCINLSNSKNAPDKLKRESTKRGAAYGQHSLKSPQDHFTQVILTYEKHKNRELVNIPGSLILAVSTAHQQKAVWPGYQGLQSQSLCQAQHAAAMPGGEISGHQ
jgi:hypothetical protein